MREYGGGMRANLVFALCTALMVAWMGCSRSSFVHVAVDPGSPADNDTATDTTDICVQPDLVPKRQFIVAPYIINPKPDSVTIRFEAMDEGPAYLLYGRDGNLTHCVCVPPPKQAKIVTDEETDPAFTQHDGWIYSVTLTGLEPWTLYDYTLMGAMVPTSNAQNGFQQIADWEDFVSGHFRTAPLPGQDFVMFVYGDNQPFTMFLDPVIKRMVEMGGDLVLHTGDIVHNGFFWEFRYQYFMVASQIMRYVPHLHTSGNHEGHGEFIPFDVYFPVPGGDPVTVQNTLVSPGPRSGYLDYGNARFFVMDSERPMTAGSPQLIWLDTMLGRTVHEHPEITWLFVSWHRPTYSEADDIWGWDVREATHAVMKRWRVDAVFNGHVHAYERFVQDDVVYVITGGGGALLNPSLDKGTTYPDDNRVKADLCYHFVRAEIGSKSASFRAIRAQDGSEIESFTIQAKDRSGL